MNRVGKSIFSDLSSHPIADFLLASEVLGFPTDVQVNLIAVVVFDRIDLALDARDCPRWSSKLGQVEESIDWDVREYRHLSVSHSCLGSPILMMEQRGSACLVSLQR